MIRNVVLPIIVCSLLLIVQACSSGHEDEVEPVVEEKGFTVKVFYINEAQPDVEIPDAGAKVYLYYGVNNGELVRGEFQAGGYNVFSGPNVSDRWGWDDRYYSFI